MTPSADGSSRPIFGPAAAGGKNSQEALTSWLARTLHGGSDLALILIAALCCSQLRLEVELDGKPLLHITPRSVTLKLLEVKSSSTKVRAACWSMLAVVCVCARRFSAVGVYVGAARQVTSASLPARSPA